MDDDDFELAYSRTKAAINSFFDASIYESENRNPGDCRDTDRMFQGAALVMLEDIAASLREIVRSGVKRNPTLPRP